MIPFTEVVQKGKTTDSSPAQLSNLLKGANDKDDGAAFAKLLGKISSGTGILLGATDTKDEPKLELELPTIKEDEESHLQPNLTKNLKPVEIKALISDAKEFLKKQILQKMDEKSAKELPKTLGGLIKLAKKLDVDLSELKYAKISGKNANSLIPPSHKVLADIATPKVNADIHSKLSVSPELKKQVLEQNRESASSTKISDPLRELLHGSGKNSSETATKVATVAIKDDDKKLNLKENPTKNISVTKESIINEVNSKSSPTKELFGTTLSSLLQGDDIEQLQESDNKETPKTVIKTSTDINLAIKSEESSKLNSKIGEAKQMIKHLATNLKEAVENYKPPFTRLSMKLNPSKLGEVNVTLIQRGDNVHININSNTLAVTALSQNLNELKTQLANNGINNATMNFSSGGDGQQKGHEQQQQRQKDANDAYTALLDEEVMDELEIIIPRYI